MEPSKTRGKGVVTRQTRKRYLRGTVFSQIGRKGTGGKEIGHVTQVQHHSKVARGKKKPSLKRLLWSKGRGQTDDKNKKWTEVFTKSH